MNMKTKKRKTEDEIDPECKKEAERFVRDLTDDVQIYKKIRKLDNFKQNINADNFVAWWELGRFANHPHALIILYENLECIENFIGNYTMWDGFKQLQVKLELLYIYLIMYEMDK